MDTSDAKVKVRSRRRLLVLIVSYSVLILACLVALFPVLWTFSTSLKDISDALSIPPKLVGFPASLDNYTKLVQTPDFASTYWATIQITLGSTLLAVIVGTLAAYPLARRRRLVARRPLEVSLVIIRAIPPIVLLVPLYNVVISVGLYDNIWAIIVVYAAFNLPFVVWLMVSFIQQIPYELEECAEIDGASRITIFRRLILPLSLPGLGATTILSALLAWNEFLVPLVLSAKSARTFPLLISTFVQARTIDWGVMAAGAMIAIVPIAIVTVVAQRSLVSGLGLGAVKG